MKLTLALNILIFMVLFVNYHQALCKAIESFQTEAIEKKIAEVRAKRQSFPSEDDYYDEEDDEEEEDELKQSLNDESYEGTAGAETEEEDDNEDNEGDEEDEGYGERFMENTLLLKNVFDIIRG